MPLPGGIVTPGDYDMPDVMGPAGLATADGFASLRLHLSGCLIQIAATMAQCGVLAAAYRQLIGVRA